MSNTKQRAGLAVAIYVDNAQGRRLMVATEGRHGELHPVLLATNRTEAMHAIAALRQLAEELPPGQGEEATITPPPRERLCVSCGVAFKPNEHRREAETGGHEHGAGCPS